MTTVALIMTWPCDLGLNHNIGAFIIADTILEVPYYMGPKPLF